MDALPIAIFWLLAGWGALSRRPVLLYLFFASMPFGSFAVIPTNVTGGLTLTATPMVALLLIARQLCNRDGLTWAANAALRPDSLLLLTLFWATAVFATLFMPHLFAGAVTIVPMRITAFMETARLQPTTQNLSQLVYVSISVLAVFAFARMLRAPAMRAHVAAALCLGAALSVLTGVLDQLSLSLPIGPLLLPFRTASYALLTDVEMLDGKRVVGLMPEASAFGALVLGFLVWLYFFRRAMPAGPLRDRIVPLLMAALLAMVWMSTSSAAYLALGMFAAVVVAEWVWRALHARHNSYLGRGLMQEFWIGAGAACAFAIAVALAPDVFAPVLRMLDLMLFQKTGSSSFEERGMWTAVSWQALLDTYGLGVGMGGTRASNFLVALASNVGLLGALLYFMFMLQSLLLRRARDGDAQGQALLDAVGWSYLAPFIASLLIGTSADFGLRNSFLYGLALAVAQAPRSIVAVARERQDTPLWTALPARGVTDVG